MSEAGGSEHTGRTPGPGARRHLATRIAALVFALLLAAWWAAVLRSALVVWGGLRPGEAGTILLGVLAMAGWYRALQRPRRFPALMSVGFLALGLSMAGSLAIVAELAGAMLEAGAQAGADVARHPVEVLVTVPVGGALGAMAGIAAVLYPAAAIAGVSLVLAALFAVPWRRLLGRDQSI